MKTINSPKQISLFDSFDLVLTERARQRLLDDWPGVFQHVILELMPADELGSHLHATMGRHSKELYSMAGLILLMEMNNWPKKEAVTQYCFNMAVHYALNLEPIAQDLSVLYVCILQRCNLIELAFSLHDFDGFAHVTDYVVDLTLGEV